MCSPPPPTPTPVAVRSGRAGAVAAGTATNRRRGHNGMANSHTQRLMSLARLIVACVALAVAAWGAAVVTDTPEWLPVASAQVLPPEAPPTWDQRAGHSTVFWDDGSDGVQKLLIFGGFSFQCQETAVRRCDVL